MLINNEGLVARLDELNNVLKERPWPERSDLRNLLAGTGSFGRATRRAPKDAYAILNGRPLVAVDGSYQTIGSSYPYMLSLFQAYARALAGDFGTDAGITLQDIFCPLLPKDRAVVDDLSGKEGSTPELAALSNAKRFMAVMEMKAALNSLDIYRPALLLLDGGFVQYLFRAKEEWDLLLQKSRESGTILVGVIEEVSSQVLRQALREAWIWADLPYDRELLYGTLDEGEYYKVNPSQTAKYGFRTMFARLSHHPQAIGLDYLEPFEEHMPAIVDLLASLTSEIGRGVPSWVDIIDRYVRLTNNETEQLLARLDYSLRDRLLIPSRARRMI